jgi:phytanoyl-CoA hydroxylase
MPLSRRPRADDNSDIRKSLTRNQIRDFRQNGFLHVRNLLSPHELRVISDETASLIIAAESNSGDTDFYYRVHEITHRPTPYRVEYVLDKIESARPLLAHPTLLGHVESLLGSDFIPTWDSLVFKLDGAGIGHPWHRDAAPYVAECVDHEVAAIDVGIYLDQSDTANCLWVIPGSHRWPESEAERVAEEFGTDGFDPSRALPLPVAAGDAIFHNIMTLHGSPTSCSRLRRVVYLEFRQIAAELAYGPHTPEYIPIKQNLLRRCIMQRRQTSYGAKERPFTYQPQNLSDVLDTAESNYRYPHEQYWCYHRPFAE